ncbi:MFS transporter [Streptomyces sp. NPDC004074]|uniref:MFS transporter n=1 Tax=Streptomyces sp. NPDC004074 TaxID=3154277 RepID=UPI0033B4DF1D
MTAPTATTKTPPRRTGYRDVFAVREFRAVFAAHVLSLSGTVVAVIALAVLVYRDTGSALLTAVSFALSFLPYVLGGALLAPLADRYPARRVLVTCDLVCATATALMVLPDTPVPALLALQALTSFVAPLFSGVRAASLGDILHGDAFVLSRSLMRIVAQSAQIGGNAGVGLLLVVMSPRGALLITVVGFLGSALILRCGTRHRPPTARERATGGTWTLLRDRQVRRLLALFWLPPAFMVVPEALAAPYATELGVGTAAVGLLLAANPVGSVAGELLAGGLLRPTARERLVLPLALAGLPLLLLFAARPGLTSALLILCAAGMTSAYSLGLDRWFFDALPEELRARGMTLLTAGLMTVQGLGMTLGGLVAEYVPTHVVLAGAGGIGALCVLAVARSVYRAEARRPGSETGPTAM